MLFVSWLSAFEEAERFNRDVAEFVEGLGLKASSAPS